MRLVEERSLSSILRSDLLTTLRNNDLSGKVKAGVDAQTLRTNFAGSAVAICACCARSLAAVAAWPSDPEASSFSTARAASSSTPRKFLSKSVSQLLKPIDNVLPFYYMLCRSASMAAS